MLFLKHPEGPESLPSGCRKSHVCSNTGHRTAFSCVCAAVECRQLSGGHQVVQTHRQAPQEARSVVTNSHLMYVQTPPPSSRCCCSTSPPAETGWACTSDAYRPPGAGRLMTVGLPVNKEMPVTAVPNTPSYYPNCTMGSGRDLNPGRWLQVATVLQMTKTCSVDQEQPWTHMQP